MKDELVQLLISVNAADTDDAYRDELARNLLGELREVDQVESALLAEAGEIPEGGKGGGGFDIGTLLIEIAKAGSLLPLFGALSLWLKRDKERSIKFKIGENEFEATNLSKSEQQELVRWFQEQTRYNFTK